MKFFIFLVLFLQLDINCASAQSTGLPTFCVAKFGESAETTFEPVEANRRNVTHSHIQGAVITKPDDVPNPTGFRCFIAKDIGGDKKCPKKMTYNNKRAGVAICLSKIFSLVELCPKEISEVWPELKESICINQNKGKK